MKPWPKSNSFCAPAVARTSVPRAASAVQVQVTARDAKGTVATATVSVAPPGAPPVISFVNGATTAAPLGAKATIATTVTGGTGGLKYQWTQLGGTATVLENAEKATLTTTLPRRQSINTYQLTVTDKTGQISTAEGSRSFHPEQKTKPATGGSTTRVVPLESPRAPACGVARKAELEHGIETRKPLAQLFPIIFAGFDELRQSAQLDPPDRSLGIWRSISPSWALSRRGR